jgi:hypothetical protein
MSLVGWVQKGDQDAEQFEYSREAVRRERWGTLMLCGLLAVQAGLSVDNRAFDRSSGLGCFFGMSAVGSGVLLFVVLLILLCNFRRL